MKTELTELVRSGDLASYGELFALHRKRAFQLARRYTYNQSNCDELVSQAFEKILLALLKGNGPSDEAFRSYLYVVLRNEATNFANSEFRHQAVATKLSALPPERDPWEDAIAKIDDLPLIAAATRAYLGLSARYRLVLRLTTVEKMSRPVVCELLSLNSNAVDALAYRARRQLRRAFEQERKQDVEGHPVTMDMVRSILIPGQTRGLAKSHSAAPAHQMAESIGRSGPP